MFSKLGRPVGCRTAGRAAPPPRPHTGSVFQGGSGAAELRDPREEPPQSPHHQPPPQRPPAARHVTLFTRAAARRTRARPHSFELRNTGPGGPPRGPAAAPPAGLNPHARTPQTLPVPHGRYSRSGHSTLSLTHRGRQPVPGENKAARKGGDSPPIPLVFVV